MKSRKSFLNTVHPGAKAENTRIALWKEKMPNLPRKVSMSMIASEYLPPGADSTWVEWKYLNRLRTGTGWCKETLKKWGYLSKTQSKAHLLG